MVRQFANIEEFRQFLKQENDKAQGRLWRFMSKDEQASTLAAGQCWNDNDPITNAFLEKYLAYFNQHSQRRQHDANPIPTFFDVLALLHSLGEPGSSG